MLKKIIAVFIVTTGLGSISAQTFIGKLNPFPNYKPSSLIANDTIKILGIMVDFQEDKDGATFGDVKFGSIYGSEYGNTIIFFFQAEDGIRDWSVTGVQTCALPI